MPDNAEDAEGKPRRYAEVSRENENAEDSEDARRAAARRAAPHTSTAGRMRLQLYKPSSRLSLE